MLRRPVLAVGLGLCACSLDSSGGGAGSASGGGDDGTTSTGSGSAGSQTQASNTGGSQSGGAATDGSTTVGASATQTGTGSPTSTTDSTSDASSTSGPSTGEPSTGSTGCVTQTWYYDGDSDGAGNPDDSVQACRAPAGYVDNNADCDDGNDAIHPGASEVCDGEDNDCDGKLDEHSVDNTSCNGCSSLADGGVAYYFCPGAIDWFDAAAGCEAFGATLVSIHDDPENTLVRTGFDEAGIEEGWLGATDEAVEGQWEWLDGTNFDYEPWTSGAPDNYGSGEHCAEQEADGEWQDVACGQLNDGYACKDPAF